ncbi:MAG TPA: hypothetical protein VKD90_20610, partial [Gemmataceae bacterium]|nr:hypothetical protein [Gemmataceae bacterium]
LAWTRPAALAQASPEATATAVRPPDPPAPTVAPVSGEIEKLVKSLQDAEDQRKGEARKAAERIAELERQAAARLEETNRRAEEERRRAEDAAQQRAIAAEEQRRIDARRAEDERQRAEEQARLRADEQARFQATLDAARRLESDRLAEEQRRTAWALELERRRIEAERRRLEERRAVGPQVTGVGFWADRPAIRGPLPQTVTFSGWVTSDGPTTVRYRFRRSDGVVGPVQTLTFARAGRQSVSTTWGLGVAYTGWVSLEVLDPNPVTSTRAAFSVGP